MALHALHQNKKISTLQNSDLQTFCARDVVEWKYFATSHGKGSVDGVGRRAKSLVLTATKSKSGCVVQSSQDFASLVTKLMPRWNLSDSQEMLDAYNAVMSRTMTLNGASKYYSINKKSLLRRMRSEIPVNAHVGRVTAISPIHEGEMAECLVMAEWGYGFTPGETRDISCRVCKVKQLDNNIQRWISWERLAAELSQKTP